MLLDEIVELKKEQLDKEMDNLNEEMI